MKHSFTTFITTLLLSVFLAIPALAYDVEVDGIYYTIDGNTVSVTCGDIKYSGDIVIPETITINDTKYNVTSIEDIAFWFCTNLTSVSIPNSVTSIGVAAFSHCSELSSVVIPNSVKRIERETFEFCYRLKSVTIPNSVTSIGNSAFSNCSSLTTVTIPNSVTNIGDNVFLDCAGLTRPIIVNDMFVFLPKGYTGHYTIPENISKIIGGAFFCCCELTSVTIPNSVTSIGNGAFFYCSSLTSITIPNSVSSIGDNAFEGCNRLASITIPNSVSSIGDCAFYGCGEITKPIIVNDMFVFLPKGYVGHYTIPENISKIIGGAFANCLCLTSITISNSVTRIGDMAFHSCYGLTSISIPNKVTCIGNYVFEDCSGLLSITINNSEISIGECAFSECIALKDVFSYADNVPNTEISAFDRTDLECATLHVPASAMKKYKTTEPWSKFGTITEIIETGIISILNHSNSIQSADGFVTISGLDTSEQVDFFSTDGKALGSAKAMGGTATFAAQSGSVVVAKIGKESVKIVVK